MEDTLFEQESGDSRYNCRVAMEANAAGPTRPASAQSTVPTEHRMMFAHMRVDRQVGKQRRRSLDALPCLHCDI